MSGTAKGLRRTRAFQGTIVLFEIGDATFEMLRGEAAYALIPAVCAVVIALAMLWLTRKIRQREYLGRPRADYAAIAAMERDIWGRSFEHDGAPAMSVARLRVKMDDLAERATTRLPEGYVLCPRGHSYYAGGYRGRPLPEWPRCSDCEEERHNKRYPDATEPAAKEQYAAWLRGYIKRGGKPTHFYDYPFSRAGFRFASSLLTVDSDYEFGARSRMIVVASGVRTERTRPTGPFGGWGHTKVFFMHGYRTNSNVVPVYSDPEFGFAR